MIGNRFFTYLFVAAIVPSFCGASTTTLKDIAWLSRDRTPIVQNNEPTIAVNPNRPNQIAVVAFSGNWSGQTGAPVWKSDDGGESWRRVAQISEPPLDSDDLYPMGPVDQKVAYDRDGNLHVAAEGIDIMSNSYDYMYHPNRAPSSDAPLVAGEPYGADQPLLEIDNNATRCGKTAYSPWHGYDYSANRDMSHVETSPDFGGKVYDHPTGDPNLSDVNTRVALASDSKAYVVFKTRKWVLQPDFENGKIMVQGSDDCGAHWNSIWDLGHPWVSVTGTTWVETYRTDGLGRFGAGPMTNRTLGGSASIAVADDTGEVYVSYVNRYGPSGPTQIYVARRTNQGVGWTTARVTDGTHNSDFTEIAAAEGGAVGVLYIDYDTSSGTTIYRHHFAVSHDRGRTWEDEILQTMDPTNLPNASPQFIWGEYEGLVAVGSQFYGVFTGRSINRPAGAAQLDPIFFTVPASTTSEAQQPRLPASSARH